MQRPSLTDNLSHDDDHVRPLGFDLVRGVFRLEPPSTVDHVHSDGRHGIERESQVRELPCRRQRDLGDDYLRRRPREHSNLLIVCVAIVGNFGGSFSSISYGFFVVLRAESRALVSP